MKKIVFMFAFVCCAFGAFAAKDMATGQNSMITGDPESPCIVCNQCNGMLICAFAMSGCNTAEQLLDAAMDDMGCQKNSDEANTPQ